MQISFGVAVGRDGRDEGLGEVHVRRTGGRHDALVGHEVALAAPYGDDPGDLQQRDPFAQGTDGLAVFEGLTQEVQGVTVVGQRLDAPLSPGTSTASYNTEATVVSARVTGTS